MSNNIKKCLLCGGNKVSFFNKDKHRSFNSCENCGVIFVSEQDLLTREAEKKRYDQHQNDGEDAGYLAHLTGVVNQVKRTVESGKKGLDFGSGPQPVLSSLLTESGYEMRYYDLFYQPDTSVFDEKFDFITCCEVIEHAYGAFETWEQIDQILKSGGVLVLKTQLYDFGVYFKNWYYKNDKTHVVFYTRKSINWVAKHFKLKVEFVGDNIGVFYKS